MNDYQRIALVIRYLDERYSEQPDLAVLAEYLGLSDFHFHRLFFAWAGITPKEFLRGLTLSQTRKLLRQGRSVPDHFLLAELSGPDSRSAFRVNLETALPGELKTGGEGWVISAGFADSPFGRCLVAESPRGLCQLSFADSQDGLAEWAALQQSWPQARLQRDDSVARRITETVFMRPGKTGSRPVLRAFAQGTPFQLRVWRALLSVPPGALVSYGQLAAALGQPTAARAVGTALGQNPLACLVPCHRVIRATGVMGDYRWGQVRKHALVIWENAPRSSSETLGWKSP